MYRRNLPHWHPPGAAVFVTWRLAGTLPLLRGQVADGRRFVERDQLLDTTSTGPQWLRRPEIAECVVAALRDGAVDRYDLHSFVVMPNHVHLLVMPRIELAAITRAIKGRSSREANIVLGRTGLPFWQDESFDHWIRHPKQFDKVRAYIEHNPVRAGLVQRAELWPYSSANPTQPVPPSCRSQTILADSLAGVMGLFQCKPDTG